ncbi:hypothetical protein ACKI14_02505 [Streptomyces turgidiscabies]|uniref:hypothetical protein n=1 Tax=Streptomyces turgidiscabies TaxID=85558 RepID=UPI0038F7C4EA
MTIEGIDEDDACSGTCCTEPERRPTNAHRVRLLTPLPARTRLRLAVRGRIDRVCAWLCWHRCGRLARWIWRASGMA